MGPIGIVGGSITGLATGLVSGAFSGGFMALLPGGSGDFLKGALQGAVSGAVGGAIIGGVAGGLTTPKGNNIWTGVAKRPIATPISELKSSGIVSTVDDGLPLQADGMPARGTGNGISIDTTKPVVQGIDGRAGGSLNIQALDEVVINAKGGETLYNFGSTAGKHFANPARKVPLQIMDDVIKNTKGLADPRGSRAMMHYSKMFRNGKPYNLEILYDKTTNSIWHFKYGRGAMGPLQKIMK